jgi:AcrR family transcriptional regulator
MRKSIGSSRCLKSQFKFSSKMMGWKYTNDRSFVSLLVMVILSEFKRSIQSAIVEAAPPGNASMGNGRKAQIARIATELFHRKGYAATSMRELASVSGIEAPSLYNHFSSKETLLHEICFGMADAFVSTARRIAAMDLPVEDRLARAIEEHLRLLFSDREAVGVFVNEWRHLSEPSLHTFKSLRSDYEQFFAGLFQEGMRQGVFIQGDPLWLGRQLLLLMNGSVHSTARLDEDAIAQLGQRFFNLWMGGVASRPTQIS